MKLISLVVLLVSFASFAQTVRPSHCFEGNLYSNEGTIIYHFPFNSQCQSALAQSHVSHGNFCDDEKLVRENGIVAYIFSFRSDCSSAISELRSSPFKLFCDGGELVSLDEGAVVDLNFKTNCQNALMEANRYRGHFCNESVMMNYRGERLYEFSFQSKCRKALMQLIFEK